MKRETKTVFAYASDVMHPGGYYEGGMLPGLLGNAIQAKKNQMAKEGWTYLGGERFKDHAELNFRRELQDDPQDQT